jgi:hypothetical protein
MSQDYQQKSYTDKRLDFDNILITDSKDFLVNQFLDKANENIKFSKFKIHFNLFIATLEIILDYKLEDLLDYMHVNSLINSSIQINYKGENVLLNSLSTYVMSIIIDALTKAIEVDTSESNEQKKNIRDKINKYIDDNIGVNNYSSSLINNGSLKEILKSNNGLDINSIKKKVDKSIVGIDKEPALFLLNSPLFSLYNFLIKLEDRENNIKSEVNFLITNLLLVNVIKYYFLSEFLLKLLLDTRNNVNNIDNSSIESIDFNLKNLGSIVNYNDINGNNYDNDSVQILDLLFTNYKKGNLIKNDFNYSENNGLFVEIISVGNIRKKSSYNIDNMKNKIYIILKQINGINVLLKENRNIFFKQNVNNITDPTRARLQKQYDKDNLNIYIDKVNKDINKINLKNLNIQKQYEKSKNLYIVLVIFIILYILLNIYSIAYTNSESILYINAVVAVTILLTKFYKLIANSYKTLVKDLNN